MWAPRSDIVNRIAERSEITDSGTVDGVNKQTSGSELDWWTPCQRCSSQGPVGMADIVLCTSWDVNFTKAQAKRAWNNFVRSTSILK